LVENWYRFTLDKNYIRIYNMSCKVNKKTSVAKAKTLLRNGIAVVPDWKNSRKESGMPLHSWVKALVLTEPLQPNAIIQT